MSDILEQLDVNVRCERCGDFTVSAEVIAESQQLLVHGCPGSSHECPAELFATLVDASALESLAKAWEEVERSARGHSGRTLLVGRPHIDISLAPASDAEALLGGRALVGGSTSSPAERVLDLDIQSMEH